MNLPSQYQIASNAAAFDVTKVTAVGLAHHRQRTSFLMRHTLLRVDEFAITRGVNTPPTVALTSPSASTVQAGDTVALSATASDAESAVTRVQFLIDGKVFATDSSAPYTAAWKPLAAGTYTLRARAFDTTGASSLSEPVTLTVTADAATVVPRNCLGHGCFGHGRQPLHLHTYGVSGKASMLTATGVPAGLNFNPHTGVLSGIPHRAGTYLITTRAANAAGTSPAHTLTLTVAETAGRLSRPECGGRRDLLRGRDRAPRRHGPKHRRQRGVSRQRQPRVDQRVGPAQRHLGARQRRRLQPPGPQRKRLLSRVRGGGAFARAR